MPTAAIIVASEAKIDMSTSVNRWRSTAADMACSIVRMLAAGSRGSTVKIALRTVPMSWSGGILVRTAQDIGSARFMRVVRESGICARGIKTVGLGAVVRAVSRT